MKFATLYKKASTGKIVEWELEVEGDKYRSITGQQGGKKIINEWTTCKGKNIGRSNATTPEQQAISEANAKWKKQTEKHYVENIEDIDKESFFKVMLAKSYDKRKDKIKFDGALVSPKLDGIRYVCTSTVAHSRNGKPLGGANYIKSQMKALFNAYPDLICDGELYNHDFKDDFNILVSLIKRDASKITKEKQADIEKYLQYHIYDIPRFNGLTEKDSYIKRFEAFWTVIDNEYPELKGILKKVEYAPVSNHEGVSKAFTECIGNGYEGAIVRFDTKYENKRTWNLLKVKEFMDEEFEIVEVLEGRGRKEGTAGSLTMKMKDGKTFNSNIKGGYAFYDQVWKAKDKLVGKTATIQFFEYTEYGIPRFPYCIKIAREDYE